MENTSVTKTAIIFGAGGHVGSYLLQELLNDPAYARITAVVRKPLAVTHPKLNVLIGDYGTLPALQSGMTADEIFKNPQAGAVFCTTGLINQDYIQRNYKYDKFSLTC